MKEYLVRPAAAGYSSPICGTFGCHMRAIRPAAAGRTNSTIKDTKHSIEKQIKEQGFESKAYGILYYTLVFFSK